MSECSSISTKLDKQCNSPQSSTPSERHHILDSIRPAPDDLTEKDEGQHEAKIQQGSKESSNGQGLHWVDVKTTVQKNTLHSISSSQRSLSSWTTIEDLEDSVLPVYMRDATTYRMYAQEKLKRANEALNSKTRPKIGPYTIKWRVQDVNLNAWRLNKVDTRTIYGPLEVDAKPLLNSDLPPPRAKPTSSLLTLCKSQDYSGTRQERGYIQVSRLRSSSRKIPSTINEYNKPINSSGDKESYGCPKLSLDLNNQVPKKPLFQTISCHKLNRGNRSKKRMMQSCNHGNVLNDQICEVLGPSVCSKCIEMVDREIADKIQKEGLPDLDLTVTTMVAPKLASIMARGEHMMAEGKRKKDRKNKRRTSSSLKMYFPNIVNKSGADVAKFGRAGVEKIWEANAKNHGMQKEAWPNLVQEILQPQKNNLKYNTNIAKGPNLARS